MAPILGSLLAAGLTTVSLSGCNSTLGYAAEVNGSTISQATINQDLADLSANSKYVQLIDQPGGTGPVAGSSAGTYNKAFVAVLLDQQVQFELIRQQLAATHALPSQAQMDAARATVTQRFPAGVFAAFPARYQNLLAVQQAEADAFIKTVATTLSADAVNQYYQSHLGTWISEACISHILIANKGLADNIDFASSLALATRLKAQIDAGADFAAVAKVSSQDNQGTTGGSAAQGGMLTGSAADGCLSTQDLQQLITPFAQAATVLPVNKVSDPVRTQFGYHLILVTKRVVEPLDATVTADIQARVAGERLNQLVGQARVKVNPEFGSYDNKANATGRIPGVTPPLVANLSPPTTAAAAAATGQTSSGG
jgi:parvulin-like peptidyl-prolyl isomerase